MWRISTNVVLIKSMGVQDFYTGKTVFITGSTGFMGKVSFKSFIRDLVKLNPPFL